MVNEAIPIDARQLRLAYTATTNCTSSEAVSLSLAEQVPCGDHSPGKIVDAEGTVYSSLRGELYMIGDDFSYVGTDAHVYALANGRWQHIRMDGNSGSRSRFGTARAHPATAYPPDRRLPTSASLHRTSVGRRLLVFCRPANPRLSP